MRASEPGGGIVHLYCVLYEVSTRYGLTATADLKPEVWTRATYISTHRVFSIGGKCGPKFAIL